MDFSPENIYLFGAALLFVSVIASKLGSRTGIPLLVLFLAVGMLAGVDGLGIVFSDSTAARTIGNIALVIILFAGGMDTKFGNVKKIFSEGVVLATVGVLITAFVTGGFIYLLMQNSEYASMFGFLNCLLLASVMSSTDSASVFGIIRGKGMHIKSKIQSLLEFESGSNDPMAYMLTIILIQIITTPEDLSVSSIITTLLLQLIIGFASGILFGKIIVRLMNNINLGNDSFYAILLLSCASLVFSLTTLCLGNGFLAVYVAGIVIGNKKMIHKKSIMHFTNGMVWMFQIIMFLVLGLLVNPHEMLPIVWIGLLVGVFLIFVGRPISVFLSLIYSRKISNKGKLFVSWVGLRGAVPIIFATYPMTENLPIAQMIFNIVFFITLLSLIVQGMTIPFMARLLSQEIGPEDAEYTKQSAFNIELPDNVKGAMAEVVIDKKALENGNKMMYLSLPENTLAVMVKRDHKYIIPKGNTIIEEGDILLLISNSESELTDVSKQLSSKSGK